VRATEPIHDREIRHWSPAADMKEDENEYRIEVELPGMKKEDIKVMGSTADQRVLIIHGERKHEKDVNDKGYHRMARSYGRFCLKFPIPKDVDEQKPFQKEYGDGILCVYLPKSEKAKIKTVCKSKKGQAK
jgi:HSP20 family protein